MGRTSCSCAILIGRPGCPLTPTIIAADAACNSSIDGVWPSLAAMGDPLITATLPLVAAGVPSRTETQLLLTAELPPHSDRGGPMILLHRRSQHRLLCLFFQPFPALQQCCQSTGSGRESACFLSTVHSSCRLSVLPLLPASQEDQRGMST